MTTFEGGSWVWISDEEEKYLPAEVLQTFKRGSATTVRTEDGEDHILTAAQSADLVDCNPEALNSSIDDLINISDLNEMSILHNLRIRYKEDKIYTNVSSILISVNPFKLLPLYTPEILDLYRSGSRDKPPHVFAIAYNAYNNMLGESSDQSVVISGESGAGKSEATKLILQFLTDVSGRAGGKTLASSNLEQQILAANPILEAFGNAKTLRNNNSSRFGKLITVNFDSNGAIIGGGIVNYLLEKSRVVGQTKGERNYHIFYQLLSVGDANPVLQEKLKLQDPELFDYTGQSGVIHIDGVSDEKEFEDVQNSMNILKFTPEEQEAVMSLVAGVLHFGNVKFNVQKKAMEEDGCVIANPDQLDHACKLWGCDSPSMTKCLTSRNIGNRSIILVSYSVSQAQDARDAMVKRVYSELFQFVVNKINDVLGSSGIVRNKFIGVLDIFGFESFEVNSFEQLCINYCNEKLQFHFNEHIFRLEQNLYQSEGITISSTAFQDNQPTLDLLEAKMTGVFSMIDEEINVPRGSDDGMLQKIFQKHNTKHPNMLKPKAKDCKDILKCFGILHYAGPVFYNVTNFLDKNKDQIHADIIGTLKGSSFNLIHTLFDSVTAKDDAAGAKRGAGKPTGAKTLGAQFKQQLSELMTTLNSTSPHFVRCMKPNDSKVGNMFTAGRMVDQLRYAGLVEVCRIRKLGYPVRRDLDSFYKKYKCIFPTATTIDALLDRLVAGKFLVEGEWAKGISKVFMRTLQSLKLEEAREQAFQIVAVHVQKIIRKHLAKRKFHYWMRLIQNVKDGIKSRSEEQLTYALDMSFELPWGGKHMKLIKDALVLQETLRQENRVKQLLQNAITALELNSLRSAIAAATSMVPPLVSPLIDQAKTVLAKLELELQVKNDLLSAIAKRSREGIAALLVKAKSMNMDCNETRQGEALMARLVEEDNAILNLKKAVASKDINALDSAISKCGEMGLDNVDIQEAKTLQDRLRNELKARNAVREAMTTRQLDVITAAIAKATAIGIASSDPDISAATSLSNQLRVEIAAISKLDAAVDSSNQSALESAVEGALSVGLRADSCNSLNVAQGMIERMKAEKRALDALIAALSGSDLEVISSTLAEASRLGLTGATVDEARSKFKHLGAKNDAISKLSSVCSSDSLSEVEAALAEAATLNLMSTPEAAAVIAKRDRLIEEKVCIDELQELISVVNISTLNDLSRSVATAMRLNLGSKYPDIMSVAKEKAKRLGDEVQFNMKVEMAARNLDIDALNDAITKAKEAGINVSVGDKKLQETIVKTDLVKQITTALEAKNGDLLITLLENASAIGLSGSIIEEAKVFTGRKDIISKIYETFKKAEREMDLSLLNSALQTAIELGLQSPEVSAAQKLREKLAIFEGGASEISAANQVVVVRLEVGVVEADLTSLKNAIEKAEKLNPPEGWVPLLEAKNNMEIYHRHISTRLELQAAIASGDRNQLRVALGNAENLDMQIDEVRQVKELLKTSDKHAAPTERVAVQDQDYEQAERTRNEKKELARQARFDLKNFSGLRTPDDFAKGAILNKQSVKDKFLVWQGTVISKSLMDLPKESSKVAIQIHKDLLGYMGDKHMPFPAMLAQDVLRKGYETPSIRDEVFLQIIKQLSTNPRAESVAKGWQLMCMCVSTFPPSSDFENFLLHYILLKLEKGRGAVVDYARYCLRTLEGMLSSGESSGFVPSVEEIQAYKERPPILATIELVDGQVITEDLPVTPDLNVGKVLEICSGWLDLKDPRTTTMGIFVYDLGEISETREGPDPYAGAPYADLVRTPRPLRTEDYMGDVIVQKARQRRRFKFVLKKKIFLPQHNARGDDPYYERLVYLQAEDEVIVQGNVEVQTEAQATSLAAMSMVIAFGQDMPDTSSGLITEGVIDFIPASWRSRQTPDVWGNKILALRNRCIAKDTETLQAEFVSIAQTLPYYGTHWFYVHKVNNTPKLVADLPHDLLLAFNSDGMHIFSSDRKLHHSFAFADIYRWGGSSSQFSLIIWDSELKESFEFIVTTAQAADMAAVILDHIRTIMALQDSGSS